MAKRDVRHKKGGKSKIGAFFRDERTRVAMGIVLLLCTLYVFLAMVSFFFTGAADQSIVLSDSISREEMKRQVVNWTGVQGAIIAERVVNDGFGVAAYLMLLFPFVLSFRLMGIRVMSLWKSFLFPAVLMLWGSLFLEFCFGGLMSGSFISIGGAFGVNMCDWLISNIGVPGTLFVILGTGLVFAVFAFRATVPALRRVFSAAGRVKKGIHAGGRAAERKEEKEAEREKAVKIGDDIVPPEWVGEKDEEERATTSEIVFETENEARTERGEVQIETVNRENDDDLVAVAEDGAPDVESTVPEDGESVEENMEPYDPTLDLSRYRYPTLDLLKEYPQPAVSVTKEEQSANQQKIITTLKNFGIGVKKIYETIGPTITLYEIVPEDGIRISKIKNLEADIMMSLAAIGIRIIAPMPGKGTIGIEVPNSNPRIVSMYATIASKKFQESTYDLPVALGRTITNDVFMFDLCKMPHLLVAGATGQGKSVGLNAIITSLLYKKHPSQLKLVLVDPKKVEFNIYSGIEKHFLAKLPEEDEPVITDTTKVVQTLNSLCKEMDARYDLLKLAHARNIKEYNEKFINRKLNPLKGHRYLPYFVVIVDEFGDLIMTAGKEVELPIARIAQLARAVGIHMILATQRPSVNIITGIIKANFPARVAFKVSSGVDSKTILDGPGADRLIGRGDLLFSQGNDLTRVQCAFVDTPEVERIVEYIGSQQGYPSAFELPEPDMPDGENDLSSVDMSKRDPYFEEVARYVVNAQLGSTSNIQRKFEIGFNRAGRIMDQLEVAGIVGPAKGSKPREVLVQTEADLEYIFKSL